MVLSRRRGSSAGQWGISPHSSNSFFHIFVEVGESFVPLHAHSGNGQDRKSTRLNSSHNQRRALERSSEFNRNTRGATKQPPPYDDASPTGGSFPLNEDKNSGGSTWDRIRRNAASGQAQPDQRSHHNTARPIQREQSESSTLGDSFSFSSTDEERQLAKTEAQREFDDRLERERKGGDFEDRGKRW